MTTLSGLAMSWEEWHKHDAVALAELVRAKEVTAKQLCAQAAEAVNRIDPQIEAVLGSITTSLLIPIQIVRTGRACSMACPSF